MVGPLLFHSPILPSAAVVLGGISQCPILYSFRSAKDGAWDLEGDGERAARERGALPGREPLRRRSAQSSPAAAAAAAAGGEPGVGGGVLFARGRRVGRHARQERMRFLKVEAYGGLWRNA